MSICSKCVLVSLFIFFVSSWVLLDVVLRPNWTYNEEISRSNVVTSRPPHPDGSKDRIFWFIQLSDIHISRFYDPGRASDLKDFATKYVDIFRPKVVLVTGDLTDAKHANLMGSEQFKDEWITYNNVLRETGVLEKTVWLDVRGNHDVFNVVSFDSETNYFKEFSSQKKATYQHTLRTPYGRYSFVGVDACPNPGPKRPFNFFGYLSQTDLAHLDALSEETRASNVTVWFGHYPTSLIVSDRSAGGRNPIGKSSVYLCGHLHNLGGLVPRMYVRQKAGGLELELGDWKSNRMYRLMAIDHDLFSFTDVSYGNWPVVLVTNPKHALYRIPSHEPLGRIKDSTHIRILAFSDVDITAVTVSIDDVTLGSATHSGGPLFVLPWLPSDYAKGAHTISVNVKDTQSRSQTVTQPFAMGTEGTDLNFDLMARVILMSNLETVVKVFFLASLFICVAPLVFCRYYRRPILSGSSFPLLQAAYSRWSLVAHVDSLYYILVAFTLYISFGPWFVGEVLDGHIGACFAFGLYVRGVFIPENTTFAYAILQIVLFNIPLIFYLGGCVQRRQDAWRTGSSSTTETWPGFLRRDWLFLILMAYQASCAYQGFYLAYGSMAFMLGPVRTWSILLGIFLRKKALTVPKQYLEHLHTKGNNSNGHIKTPH